MNTQLNAAEMHMKYWADIIRDRKESGLKVKDYCAEHNLSRDAYYYWYHKIKNKALIEANNRVEFAAVPTNAMETLSEPQDGYSFDDDNKDTDGKNPSIIVKINGMRIDVLEE
jgi:hypothetical protein